MLLDDKIELLLSQVGEEQKKTLNKFYCDISLTKSFDFFEKFEKSYKKKNNAYELIINYINAVCDVAETSGSKNKELTFGYYDLPLRILSEYQIKEKDYDVLIKFLKMGVIESGSKKFVIGKREWFDFVRFNLSKYKFLEFKKLLEGEEESIGDSFFLNEDDNNKVKTLNINLPKILSDYSIFKVDFNMSLDMMVDFFVTEKPLGVLDCCRIPPHQSKILFIYNKGFNDNFESVVEKILPQIIENLNLKKSFSIENRNVFFKKLKLNLELDVKDIKINNKFKL